MKKLYELHGQGESIRGIAGELGISRNTVRKDLRSEKFSGEKPRPKRASKLEPYMKHTNDRFAEGVSNCMVPMTEIGAQGATYEAWKFGALRFDRPKRPEDKW